MPIDAKNYGWLDDVGTLPRMVVEARRLIGTLEVPGVRDNPVIMGWAKEIGGATERVYTADSVAWCGLFMAVIARRAGKVVPEGALWALNWRHFGTAAGQPALGDVLTFMRDQGGHVGLYIGEDHAAYHVLGGNQSDQVCFARIDKTRVRAARRPLYRVAPAAVRPYILEAAGAMSSDER